MKYHENGILPITLIYFSWYFSKTVVTSRTYLGNLEFLRNDFFVVLMILKTKSKKLKKKKFTQKSFKTLEKLEKSKTPQVKLQA